MKKNISINISGIIFHIEEDGYEILRKYLDSINRYFSSFEDNSEILADIESRIAEILLSKLSEGKQVVTVEDVNTLMATMGSVNDFKAAEDQDNAGSESKQQQQSQSTAGAHNNITNKKLYRDEKRKILGGVCAGLAHYFNIDPVWIRLFFAIIAFPTYGILFAVYIVMWIVIPPSNTLEDESTVKKMYRDRENKVLGGVSSGLAAFLGIDAIIIRVAFIVLAFGGIGIVVYIIMWIALPEAKTITEKIQMQGEPVTLSNIESSVKRGLADSDKDESTLAKIILFPFRLIAALIDGIAKILGPVFILVVDILRIAIGIVITLTGVLMIFSLILGFGIMLGVFTVPEGSTWADWYVSVPNFPITAFQETFPTWTLVFAFLAVFIPFMMIALLGSSIIAKKIVFNSYVGWSMFVLFFVSAGVVAFTIPQIVYNFREESEFKQELTYNITGTPVLKIKETGLDDYDVTDLTILGYDGKELKLVERFESQGRTRKEAVENAQMVTYQVEQADSTLTFDSNISFKDGAKFRAQRLNLELYIPFNRPFVIDEGMWQLIDNRNDRDYYMGSNERQTWKVNEYGVIECVSCSGRSVDTESLPSSDQFGLSGFKSLELAGIFDVRVTRGDTYAVELSGPDKEKRRYRIYTDNETLVLEYDDKRDNFWRRNSIKDYEIEVKITMPELDRVEARGGGKVSLRGFNEDETTISLTGAVHCKADLEARTLNLRLTGASYMDLSGSGDLLEADITGASGLAAYGYPVEDAIIEAHGASQAKVNVSHRLEISKGIASTVSHRGDPEIIRED